MYYPKSQIKQNLYTNGEEYILSTTKENYIGYFYEISNGDKYSGDPSSNIENILLIQQNPNIQSNSPFNPNQIIPQKSIIGVNSYPDDPINSQYPSISSIPIYTLNNKDFKLGRSLPIPTHPQPSQQDYDLGVFMRYFTKKNNENIYLEISKETYNLLKVQDPKMAWDLYTPLSISWELVGEQDKVFLTNKNIVSLAEQRNKWYGFTQWFKDNFLKYHQNLASQENLYTSGKEFKTPNGREYIGPYHIHPQNGAMVGATHIKKKHDSLTPINSTILSPQSSSQPPPNISFSPSTGGGGY